MKYMTNGMTKFLIGSDEADLQRQYGEFMELLESAENVEYSIHQVQPAILVVYTCGDPIYRDYEEDAKPVLDESINSPGNQAWLEEAATRILDDSSEQTS